MTLSIDVRICSIENLRFQMAAVRKHSCGHGQGAGPELPVQKKGADPRGSAPDH